MEDQQVTIRITRSRVEETKVDSTSLPKAMEEFINVPYVELSNVISGRRAKWVVQISPRKARSIISAHDDLQHLKRAHKKLTKSYNLLKNEFAELREYADLSDRNNAALMKNIAADDDTARRNSIKSPRNYYDAAQDRGLGVSVRGGAPNTGKRR